MSWSAALRHWALGALLALLVGVVGEGMAAAASCCSPIGGASPGVLGPDEDRGVALTLGGGIWQGVWGLDGTWDGHGDDHRDQERILAEGMLRIWGPVQAAVGAGLLRQRAVLGDVSGAEQGLGDLHAVLRWDGPRSGCAPDARRPAMLLGVALLPADEVFDEAVDGAAVPGQVSLGLDWEGNTAHGLWGAGVEGSWSAQPTARLDLRLGRSPAENLDLLLLLSPSLGADGARSLSLGLSAPWSPTPRWRLVPTVTAAPPISGLGQGESAWLLGQLTLLHLHPRAG